MSPTSPISTAIAYLGRSTLFAFLALTMTLGLTIVHLVDGAAWVTLALGLTAIVAGRAVGEDYASRPTSPTPPVAPTPPSFHQPEKN